MTSEARTAEPFTHPALFYRSDGDYLTGLVPFITVGLAAAQPVAVAVPGPKLQLLRAALGDAADRVKMIDMTRAGRNPGRIIGGVLRRFADAHRGAAVRIVGEPIWAGRTRTEYPACAQHEALINAAFRGRDATIVCPYDVSGLSDQVLSDARATHPEVWEADRRYASDTYAPDSVVARYNEELSAPADAASHTVENAADLSAARRFVADTARRLGLGAARIGDLELIVTELATNSLCHAGGACLLRLWRTDRHLVCATTDGGHLTDPLAGRLPPVDGTRGGHGLLLVNHLADLVRTHTSHAGTTIHAYLRLGGVEHQPG